MMLTSLFRPSLALLLSVAALGTLAGPAAAQSVDIDRLSIHGFLTQAYGITDGHQYAGLPSYGTADYRVAALQFRYDATDRDVFVVQFSHERLGRSALAEFEPEVDLDWVFYEHRFGDYTTARVGKIRSPIGIYNQIRDVGTLLPLYRPPLALYSEQTNTTETINGVMLGQHVPLGSWGLDLEGFFGSWELLQWDRETVQHVDAGLGGQLWVRTPVQGLRFGGAAIGLKARDVLMTPPGFVDDEFVWFTVVDGTFPRFFVRAESFQAVFGEEEMGWTGNSRGAYAQAGFHFTDAVSLVAQAERMDLAMDFFGPQPFSFDENTDRDFSLGIRYQPSPNLAFKLEGHAYRGYGIEDELRILGVDEPASVRYGLFSVSTSF